MTSRLRPRVASRLHVLLAIVIPAALFSWLFARFLLNDLYLADSDLYEDFLPRFLSSIRIWSSFEFSGLPVFADAGEFTFYPPDLLFGEVFRSWTMLAISAFVIAAWSTYAYVYGLTRSPAAGAFAAAAFSLSEAMMERLAHFTSIHAIAWLPLIALAVDRVRGQHPRRWIAIGAFAVANCILGGHSQATLYTLYCMGLYALIGSVIERAGVRQYWQTAAMFTLGVALAAIKVFPVLEASTLMARQQISFERFVGRALTVPQTLSALFPSVLHGDYRETPTYVGIATLLLAALAFGHVRRNWRIAFWGTVCLLALVIGMGATTPLAWLVYHLPLYDKFRVVSRHLFLFAFGASVLAGFAMADLRNRQISRRNVALGVSALLALMTAGGVAFVLAPNRFEFETGLSMPGPGLLSILNVGVWVQFGIAVVATLLTIWLWRGRSTALPATLLVIVLVADLLAALPYEVRLDGLDLKAIEASDARPSVHATALGRELAPHQQRALAFGGTQAEAVLPAAFARVWRIPIAGGYGPMLLDRYSLLAMMGTNGSVRPGLIAADNAALDLLAVRYLLVYPRDVEAPATFERDGVAWTVPQLELPVGRPDCGYPYARSASFGLPSDLTITSIALVTHLECSEQVPQGAEVATVSVRGADDHDQISTFRAGYETAETDLDEPDLRARAKHQVATRFEDPDDTSRLLYYTRIDLPAPTRATQIEFKTPGTGGWLTLDRITLLDGHGRSYPQVAPNLLLRNPTRWREVRRFSTSRTTDRITDVDVPGELEVTVFENLRVGPRAWIVPEVIGLKDKDALASIHYSQLPDGAAFNSRAVAIVDPSTLPPTTNFAPGASTAQVTRVGDGELSVVASTQGGGFLVLSESFYPGWRARIDGGDPAPVYRADVTLQGIVLPPGLHRITFELVSTPLRAGRAVSLIAILVCIVVVRRQ